MFFHVTISQNIDLEPMYFGPKLRETIRLKIVDKVEGTCSAKHGYVLSVLAVDDISKGKIRQDGSGLATFKANFQCITFRPFKGEVLDCIVNSVNKMGFFADAGPVQIFVSSHLIPDDFEYSTVNGDAFLSLDATSQIKEGSEVRIKVLGVRTDLNDMFCIGTMKEDYLGVINEGA
ncbi:hypothetical protein OEZ85_004647 [Tetradesmus obliquus]|uniref:S1 motif domain-containing protein n=1 Tax=Tetradesmus obliquus TaxID=3088 RepID=A0ABY8ULC9_TETOB|nr:hypothetical protein OEZ85_004647 [Tetradesmus obliquus]